MSFLPVEYSFFCGKPGRNNILFYCLSTHMTDYIFLILWAYIAEIAGTIAGFGSSSIFLPIASQIMTFHHALLFVAIYHIFGNLSRLSMFYTHRNKRIFLLFGIPSIIATVAGALLAWSINPDILKVLFGSVLLVFALYSMFRPDLGLTKNKLSAGIGGALSWFSAGLIGTGGVLRGAFMHAFALPKEQYIATIASVALLVDFTRIPVYFAQWFVSEEYLWLVPVLFIIAFIGSRTGKRILQYIPQQHFSKLILWCIIVASILLIVQGSGLM